MEKQVLFEIPHVTLTQSDDGIYCLIVEDTELNDYVEDFLWDNFEYQATSVTMNNKAKATYYNYFEPGLPIDRLVEALKQLDLNEVTRIYKLNN